MLSSQERCIIIKSAGIDLLSQKPENNPDRVVTLSGLFSGFCEKLFAIFTAALKFCSPKKFNAV